MSKFYHPHDLFKAYKKIQLQEAILEYVAIHNGEIQSGPNMFASFAEYLDLTVAELSYPKDITQEGNYLIAIKLLEVKNQRLYITPEGILCLQSLNLKTAEISARLGFVSNVNWLICTLISIIALGLSLLSLLCIST